MGKQKIQNMEEFAEFSGISRPTLSKYFNDPDSVRPKTRDKIERSLAKCNYQPNIFAINQNRKLTKNVGIVVPYLADPFFAEMARGIETFVIAAGYRPILLSSHGDPDLEKDNLASLRAIKPAGVLMAPLGRSSDRAAIEAFCADVPTVCFDANIEGVGAAFVGHNNVQAMELMVEYLVRSGEPPTFYEMRNPPNPNANKRRMAYIDTMEALGHTPHVIQAEGEGWKIEEIGFHEGRKALIDGAFATKTVFCSNDRLAIGFLAAAYELGLRVGLGADCALRVAGHDNHPFSSFTCPTLTTVSQDYAAITARCVEMLVELIEGQQQQNTRATILIDGKLTMRASA